MDTAFVPHNKWDGRRLYHRILQLFVIIHYPPVRSKKVDKYFLILISKQDVNAHILYALLLFPLWCFYQSPTCHASFSWLNVLATILFNE